MLPKHIRLCALVALMLCFCAVEALAGPAFRIARASRPEADNAERRSGFSISLEVDDERCKKQYGADWTQQCSAPVAGEAGRRVEGVQMTPSTPGVWRWEYGSSMRFYPEDRLAPATRYIITLDKVALPTRYDLKRVVTYVTQPQAVRIGKETLWTDPSPKGAHAVSVPLSLIWPANPQDFEKLVSIAPSDAKSGLALGAPRFVWNESRDEVVVSAPVAALAENNAAARISVRGLPIFVEKDGLRAVQVNAKAKTQNVESLFSVTGRTRLMDVTSITVNPSFDNDLDKKYQLEVKTTLRVLPSEVLRHLDVVQLPRKATPEAGRDCDWSKMPAISAQDIEQGKKLQVELLQPADEPADRILLRVPVEPGRGLLTAMREGLPSTGGLILRKVCRFILTAPSLGAELDFLQPGNVLALSGEKKLDLYAQGLTSIAWRAERIREPFLALLAQEQGFTRQENHDEEDESPSRSTNFDAMSDVLTGRLEVQKGGLKKVQGGASFPVLDMAPLLQGPQGAQHGLMRLSLTGFDGDKQVASASRLVLVTDLGMTVKTAADGARAVFVQHLGTGKPVSGAEARLLGANGLPTLTARSNDQGRADLPPTSGLEREKRPVAVVVTSPAQGGGQDMAWLSLEDSARRVDYSDFAVAGRHSAADGLSASVFSQRGLYLPGDTLHFGCIVRRFDWQALPADLPLEAVLHNPAGAEVMRSPFTLGPDGLNTFAWKSAEDSAVGEYRLDVRLAGPATGRGASMLGSASVRVEEFQPDTLALAASFEPKAPKGWIRTGGDPATAQARLDNLYGEPAAGHRVKAVFHTSPGKLRFPGLEDYSFHDATPYGGEAQSTDLPEAFTDAKGLARFALPLGKFQAGTISGSVLLEGFEPAGGRAVTRQVTALFSPLEVALGYKPEGEANNLDYVPQNAKASLRFLAVNNDLAPVDLQNAVVVLSARRYVNSLVTDTRGEYRYDATPVDTELSRQTAAITAQGLSWPLPTSGAGDYLVTVKKADGATLAVIPYSVAGTSLAGPETLSTGSLAKGNLRLKLDKEHYAAGEAIKMRLSAPFAGTGLITLERETVLAHAWFAAQPGESVQEIKIPAGFEGRGYVNVSYARALDSETVYMKPHTYAVASFMAGVAQRDMGLKIEAPARVRPGEKIKVRLTSRLPGRVQLFAVDEGVLQLTDFATPDPLRDLLADRALDVDTRQAFDLLMPDHARLRGRIPGFGGDMAGAGGRFLNPFKRRGEPPFTHWSEVLTLGKDGAEVSLTVPEYFSGRVRLMAVGSATPQGGTAAAGNTQATAEVRGTLILKPLLPLASAPGDTFEGALVIANTVEGSGPGTQVQVRMECDPRLAFVNAKTEQTLTVDENGEAVLRFKMRAEDDLGDAPVRFEAGITGKADTLARRSQSLSVRPPAPRVRTESVTPLNASADISVNRNTYPYEAVGVASISSVPVLGLRAILAKLDPYPYGCTEQLISRALPYAALLGAPALREQVLRTPDSSPETLEKRSNRVISAAIDAIRQNRSYEGVSIWPQSDTSDLLTAYAADLLLTLRESGAAVPEDLTRNVLDSLENIVGRSPSDLFDGRAKLYGAWLLLRDGRIMTQEVERLEKWYKDNTNGWEVDIVAVLMADCYNMLRLSRKGTQMMPANFNAATGDTGFSIGLSRALHAAILLRDFPQRAKEIQTDALMERAFDPRATTMDLAFTARALVALADPKASSPQGVKLTCAEYSPGFPVAAAPASLLGATLQLEAPGCLRYRVDMPSGGQTWHVRVATEGFERAPLGEAFNGMELQRRYLNSRGEAVTSAKLGEALTVELTARTEKDAVSNVVLVDLLPGGFEPVLPRPGEEAENQDGLVRHERREDRGIFFVNLGTEKRTFTYKVRAATKGRFVLPTASAEAMYAPEVNGRVGGGAITVE